jgi:hypothetical protein
MLRPGRRPLLLTGWVAAELRLDFWHRAQARASR